MFYAFFGESLKRVFFYINVLDVLISAIVFLFMRMFVLVSSYAQMFYVCFREIFLADFL